MIVERLTRLSARGRRGGVGARARRAVRARAPLVRRARGRRRRAQGRPPRGRRVATRRRTRSPSGTATAPCGCSATTAPGGRSCSSARGPGTTLRRCPRRRRRAIAVDVGAAALAAGRRAVPLDRRPRAALARASRGRAAGARARSCYARSMWAATTLVHGDFHHHNILALGARPARDRPASRCSASPSTTCRLPLEPAPVPAPARAARGAARRLRRRRARRGADADVDGDPRRLPAAAGGARCYGRSSRYGFSCSQRCSIVVVRAGWSGSYGT